MGHTLHAGLPADQAAGDHASADGVSEGVPAGTSPLIGLSRAELAEAFAGIGVAEKQQRMRASQLWGWLYGRGATDFAVMTNIAKDLRAALAERFDLGRPEIVTEQVSADGTRKWLLRLKPSRPGEKPPEIETVYIPEADRGTLCISSQVGCTLTCTFCHTGTQRLVRNLTAGEIVGQILLARDRIGDWPGAAAPDECAGLPESERKITNIVLMGMGEPLYNFDNVKSRDGDRRRRRGPVDLQAPHHAVNLRRRADDRAGGRGNGRRCWRFRSMPCATICATCWCRSTGNIRSPNCWMPAATIRACPTPRRITFEYVMLKGVNDSVAEAQELVRLLPGIPAKINLIPFNPWPGAPYECSDWEQIERFAEVVNRAGYASPIRTPRGRDIMAACGQLRSASEKIKASQLRAGWRASGQC